MSNQQFEEVTTLARTMNLDLSICPTCRRKLIEPAPGIEIWKPSTYRLYGQEHECDCEWQDNLRRHYLLAGIPSEYWTLSEDDFFGDSQALQAIQEYLDRWVDWKWHGIGLELYSPHQGTGKTMLATLIAKHLVQQGERVYFTSFRDAIRTIYDAPFEVKEAKTRRLRNTTVLVLDEVGKAISDAQWAFFADEFEDLIRFRTNGNAVTLVTTNLSPQELATGYPRTFSLLEAKQKHIQVKGMDVRKSGDLDLLREELIMNNEAKPLR